MPRGPLIPDAGPMVQWSIRTTQRARDTLTRMAANRGMSVGHLLDDITHSDPMPESLRPNQTLMDVLASAPGYDEETCAHVRSLRSNITGLHICVTCAMVQGTDGVWRAP